MPLTDRLSELTKKAQDAAVEHKDQIREAVQKAQVAADQRTGGMYRDQIRRAAEKADAFVDGLKPSSSSAPGAPDTESDVPPRASAEPGE